MKTKILALFVATAGFASAATYTYSASWSTNVTTTFTDANNTSSYDNTTGSNSNINVSTLLLSSLAVGETLESVTITYSAPSVGNSASIVGQLEVLSGSQAFDSASVSVSTKVFSNEIYGILNNAGYSSQAGLFNTTSAFYSIASNTIYNPTVNVGSPLTVGNLTRTYTTQRYVSISGPEALLLANGGSNPSLTFNIRTEQTGAFERTTTDSDVKFSFSGPDSGTITVTYTTIPEPSAALIGGLGLLCLLRRRR